MKKHLVFLGIPLLTIAVFVQSLWFPFVSLDDTMLILGNPLVHSIRPYTLLRIFTSYDPELYIPLTLLTYQLEYAIAGANPLLFHLTNLMLHIANALLVFVCIHLLTRNQWIATLCAFLFAVHPMHSDVVVWASARKDVLSTFFALMTMASYLQYRSTDLNVWKKVALCSFALGLLAKVVIALLPFWLIVLDRYHFSAKRSVKEYISFGVLSIACIGIALLGRADNPLSLSLVDTVLLASKNIAFVLKTLLLPTGLSVIHPQLDPITVQDPLIIASIVTCIAVLMLMIYWLRYRSHLFVAGSFFALMIAPNIVNFTKGGFILFADNRYAYLPSIGAFLLLAYGLHALCTTDTRQKVMTAACTVLIGCFALSSHLYARTFSSSEALYRNALNQYPQSSRILNDLGGVLEGQGDTDEALALFKQSAAIHKDFRALTNIGLIYQHRGNLDRAASSYRDAIASINNTMDQSGMFAPYYILADLEEKMNNEEASLSLLQEASKRGSAYAEPQLNVGIALQKRLRIAEAEEAFRAAVDIDPHHVAAQYHLAAVLAEQGKLTEARERLQNVLWMQPGYKNAEKHLNNINRLL